MQKNVSKLISAVSVLIASVGVVSAIDLSLSGILRSFNQQDMALFLIFCVSFVLMNFAFGKFFKDQKAIAGILAGLLALGITYFANLSGLNYSLGNLIFKFGISGDVLYPVILFAMIGLFVYVSAKSGTHLAFLGIGILLIFLSTYVYEAEILIVLGGAMVIIGGIISYIRFRKTEYHR
ncbi:hypothetical protein J4474_00450 [Candidatus Pacearchaeota archaeon]|nr:hypothetical protein [Candidatus Pacearchaeota archaeon]